MNELVITPLGTVSPYCKGDKNCPGYLFEYHDRKILVDCGNGVTRLLKFPEDLKNLSVIITHYHKDHYGDIGSIQYASHVYRKLLSMYGIGVNIYLPDNSINYSKRTIMDTEEAYCRYAFIRDGDSYYFDDLNVSFKDNKSHTIESYMVKFENEDFKVVYTSDVGTTNFDKLIEFCKDSDLLICESSLLRVDHSTINTHLRAIDAGILARESNSKKLLLTHFWPEHGKELYLEEAREVFDNVEVAEEGKKLVLRR